MEPPLLQFSPEAVNHLSITTGGLVIECLRHEGQWVLVRPMDARADELRIRRILEALDNGRIRESLSPDRLLQRNLTAASFGLESPRAQLLVGTELRTDEILVGDDAPLGELVYLRIKGNPNVIGATLKLSEILPITLDNVRDRSVFPAGLKRVTRLELKHPGGFLQLALRDGQWRIQQPVDALADNRLVERLIQSLLALKVEDFGVSEAPSDPVVYGLTPDEALMQVTLTSEGGHAPWVLTVGKIRQDIPTLIYAKISDVPSVCSINRDVLALQGVKAESLRDLRLCNANPAAIVSITLREGDSKLVLEKNEKIGWSIQEPFHFKADAQAVGGLLKAICNVKLSETSEGDITNKPKSVLPAFACRVAIASVLPSGVVTNQALVPAPAGVSWSYRFSVPAPGMAKGLVYCEETKSLVEVQAQALNLVWPQPSQSFLLGDPRPYMDRRMFEIEPSQVRRISLARSGREDTVTVGSDGVWLVDSPPDGKVIKGAIPELLSLAVSLRAERIESMNATKVLEYGIDESSPRITFGLTGTNGIQKTLLLGGACGTNGIYSMIQGQDMVFVLKKGLAQALSRPLVELR